jgi:hypothetical protein
MAVAASVRKSNPSLEVPPANRVEIADDQKGRSALSQAEIDRRTDEKFFHEGKDLAWSPQAEILARKQVYLSLPSGAELRALECRSTMCRGTLWFPSRASYESPTKILQRNIRTAEWLNAGMAWSEVRELPGGNLEQTQYLFREGDDPVGDIYRDEAARLAGSLPPN